jgi:hypothetical protein
MNAALRVLGLLSCALLAACAGSPKAPPPVVTTQSGPLTIDPSLAVSKRDNASAIGATEPRQPVAATAPPVPPAPEPIAAAAAPAAVAITPVITPVSPPPVKAAVAPLVIEKPVPKIEPAAVVVKKPEPTLDMAALKARLRDTNSIGVFTKLALKSQVDDLMKQFRAYYQSGKDSSVTSLRQPYDMLVLKVLAVVQDNDPSLAREISGSREAIWGILADRQKFNSII